MATAIFLANETAKRFLELMSKRARQFLQLPSLTL